MFRRLALAGLFLCTPAFTSCVSTRAHQSAVDEKDAEIRKLREERAALKGQIQDLRASLDNTRGELANASARVNEEPAAREEKRFPELDQLGIDYGMKNGTVTVPCRQAMLFYTLRALNFEANGAPGKGPKQVVIANLDEIKHLLPKPGQA